MIGVNVFKVRLLDGTTAFLDDVRTASLALVADAGLSRGGSRGRSLREKVRLEGVTRRAVDVIAVLHDAP